MAHIFQRLKQVLSLEAQQGYQDKAVVGGMSRFVAYWMTPAREEAVDDADTFLVEQIGESLAQYGKLPGNEAREKVVSNLLQKLAERDERVVTAPPQKSAPQQPPPPKPKREPKRNRQGQASDQARKSNEKRRKVDPDPEGLQQPLTVLKGVGPKMAELINHMGPQTVEQLMHFYPRRYDDFSLMKPINRLEVGEVVTIIGTVWQTRKRKTRNNQVIVQSTIGDGTGSLQVSWFNQAWLADKLKPQMQIALSGKIEQYLGRKVMNNPQWEQLAEETLKAGRIVPVYPLTKGLSAHRMRQIMGSSVPYWSARMPDPLPDDIRMRHKLLSLPDAVKQIHAPAAQQQIRKAQKRLSFDELLMLQLGMLGQRRDWQKQPAIELVAPDGMLDSFLAQFPFTPTGAQQRAIAEISAEMATNIPMNRLLQGDVGAGKTLVAAAAMAQAVKAGGQAALMAPTEILAEQHFNGLVAMLAPLEIEVRLLTGSTSSAEKARVYQELADGRAHIAIGTHALIQPDVSFDRLALAVIDEQHRFGVDQRGALRDKGRGATSPHLLVMSATPIPRTLALSLYGDLDVTILDEMPPGRQEIRTRWLSENERERAYRFIRRQLEEGRQAFVIYPLVEASDTVDALSAVEEAERLQSTIFPRYRVGLVHGRMKSAEKEAIMRSFHAHELDILVATTVIEVGIDVPNANVIMIDGANRFGLAQLHQLRGRVGRGQHQSYCMLISDSTAGHTVERLTALEETNDGFELAEKDLELRGPGQFFGRQQSGLPEMQMASLLDVDTLTVARQEAETLFEQDPQLEQPEHAQLRERVHRFWDNAGDFS